MTPLEEAKVSHLSWKGSLQYPEMIRIGTPGDGSCLFHAICRASSTPYQDGYIRNGNTSEPFDRREFVLKLRSELSDVLSELSNPLDSKGPTHYDLLGNGEIKNLGQTQKEFSLEGLRDRLRRPVSIGKELFEFISNQLNKDIYILSAEEEDVYFAADDLSLLYKFRESIVLLALKNHYETIGVIEAGKAVTLFQPSHPFIKEIRGRLRREKD